MTTKDQDRVARVLDNLKAIALADESDAEIIAENLQEFLDGLQWSDFFGTEAQSDPRGDFREHEWSMKHVQGIDD